MKNHTSTTTRRAKALLLLAFLALTAVAAQAQPYLYDHYTNTAERGGYTIAPNLVLQPFRAVLDMPWPGNGTEEDPYVITTVEQFEALASMVNGGNSFEGQYFILGADLSYDSGTANNHTLIGDHNTRRFSGTFDGAGHTISGIRMSGNITYPSLFGTCYASTVKNLTVTDTQISGNTRAGGIVGDNWNGTIENCHVTNTVIISGSGYVGGIAGWNDGGSIVGCTSQATVTGSGSRVGGILGANKGGHLQNLVFAGAQVTGNTRVGGILGDNLNECTIEDCHVADATVSGSTYVGGIVGWKDGGMVKYCTVADATVSAGGAIVGTNSSGTLQRNYYMGCTVGTATIGIGTGSGDVIANDGAVRGYHLTLGEYITCNALTFTIPAHGTTPEATHHVAGSGSIVTLGHELPDFAAAYYVDGEAIAGASFTMPAHDVSVTAAFIITTVGQLEALAGLVNGGNSFEGQYFILGADLSYDSGTPNNHTPIGNSGNHHFCGTFDGYYNGTYHTISGIRISNVSNYQGLFGTCYSSTVKNLTLTDAQITGSTKAAGIVSDNWDGTIENCHVTNTVVINGNKYVGGIAGWNDGGTVSGCSSMATVNGSGSCVGGLLGANKGGSLQDLILVGAQVTGNTKVGGIVGDNWNESTVEDCHVVDATISGSSLVGGIVGWKDGGMVEYCTVTDVTVSAGGGAIIGTNNNGPFQYNYYMGCTVGSATANVGTGSGDVTANDGAVRGYHLTLGEYITCDALTFTIPAHGTTPEATHHVAGSGNTVTLGHEHEGYAPTYYVDGAAIAGNSFTMPSHDVSVTATWTQLHFAQTGTDEYTIYTATGWELFCDALLDYPTYHWFLGKTVKLGADISVVRMAGSWIYPLCGTFDGQGHTLTVSYTTTEQYVAPFRYVNGATIANLTTAGSINTSAKYAGGMVGESEYDMVSITNCVSTVTINSSVNGDGSHGGFIALVSHGTVSITGCTFNGEILGANTTMCGGFVGWTESNNSATVAITNSLFNPSNLTVSGGCTFACASNMGSVTVTNSYYTERLGTVQGYPAISDPAITPSGSATGTYPVSGLTAYANGLMYGETFYNNPTMQVSALSAGWNWWSTHLNITLDDLKAALVAALPGTTITITSQGSGSTTYNGSTWRGTLSTMNLGQMYMIQVSANCSITLEGMPVDPAELPVTIVNGANWIAFPLGGSKTLAEAFAGFAVSGDMLISQSGSSTYTNRWRGTITTLEPGKGYMYISASSEPRVLWFEHAYVDLGLPSGLLWATCNVGADTPEAYGDYFAWGETAPKDTYNWSTYQHCNGSNNTLTKYCTNSSYGYNGFTDDLTVLLPEDDAATANWGEGWRMPTKAEFEELYNNTTVTWTQQNGVNGRLFTAANGNSLFLPSAGCRLNSSLGSAGGYGYYWSSSLFYSNYPVGAWILGFYSGGYGMNGGDRHFGRSVRPVRAGSQN